MIDSDMLYRRLDEAREQDDTERALLSLLHASFDDRKITFNYSIHEEAEYPRELIDAGRFAIDSYTVEKQEGQSYEVEAQASYDDLIPENVEGADFHAPVSGTIVYQLSFKGGLHTHTGHANVYVVPDWRKA